MIYAANSNKQNIELELNNARIGENILNQSFPGKINYATYYDDSFPPFVTSTVNTGKVTITRADTVSKILSGTFEFVAGRGNEKVTVTEGRFDIKF